MKEIFHRLVHSLDAPQQLGLGQASQSWPPRGWQRPQDWSHHYCLAEWAFAGSWTESYTPGSQEIPSGRTWSSQASASPAVTHHLPLILQRLCFVLEELRFNELSVTSHGSILPFFLSPCKNCDINYCKILLGNCAKPSVETFT